MIKALLLLIIFVIIFAFIESENIRMIKLVKEKGSRGKLKCKSVKKVYVTRIGKMWLGEYEYTDKEGKLSQISVESKTKPTEGEFEELVSTIGDFSYTAPYLNNPKRMQDWKSYRNSFIANLFLFLLVVAYFMLIIVAQI